MSQVFLKIVNMSISAGWLVLAVLLLRVLLKKAPKWVNVLLWGIVAVRLMFPISIESALSLIPSAETIPLNIGMDTTPAIQTGVEVLNSAVNPMISHANTPMPGASVNPLQITIAVFANIWVLGMLAMLIYTAISYLSLRRKLRTAVVLEENIFQCETVCSPFVLGILSPRIYLPYSLDGQNLSHVIAHEQAHIRRNDHLWKPLGFLLLTVYWFNPLMWLAYILLCRDIELACDEKVIAELGNEQRADYTQALVACSVNRRSITACPLAFGEVGVKERVKSILNYRKPAFWIIVVAVIACVLVAVCFLTNPLDSVDYLKFSGWSSDDPAAPNRMCYEINLGNRAMSGEIYVEEWINGECIRSAPVVMTQFVDSIYVTIGERWDEGQKVGTEVRIETNQYGGSLATYFPDPENYADTGYYFCRNELNKRIKLSPGKEVILEARSFDLAGDGYRPFDCDTLTFDKEIFRDEEYMIVIRAVFSDDPLGIIKEEPATAPYYVLQAKILEVHEGYFLVEPLPGSWELNSADKIEVPIRHMSPSPEPQVGDILQIEYDGMIQETYPARIPNVIHIALQRTTYTNAMIPTETDLRGLHAGALLLPVDGVVYRYLLTSQVPEGVTADIMLYSFQEADLQGYIDWKVYSLKEFPDMKTVAMVSESNGAWLCTYSPPGRCSDTALEDAIDAGYVIMEEGIATHGQDVWMQFYDQTRQGQPAAVTVAHYGTLDPKRCDSAYYEAFSQDYPYLSLYQLRYDGEIYTLSCLDVWDGAALYTRTYEYLMKYDTTDFYAKSSLTPGGRYDYVLTQDNSVTWEQIWNSLISSQAVSQIDHYSIYAERKQ